MEKKLINEIISALKRLIKKLESGYCQDLNKEQLSNLEDGFGKILKVEKEVNNGFVSNNNSSRKRAGLSIFHFILSFKEKRAKGKNKE